MADERETALLVAVPEAEPVVGSWRALFDPSARVGIPAHFTLLYPFLPPSRIDDAVLHDLRDLFHRERPFSFTLTAVRRFQPSILYLAPRPSQPFSRLTTILWARYPEAPPYGGQHESVIPHLTVTETADALQMDAIEERLRPALPISAVADTVRLMEQGADDHWETRVSFALGRPGRA